MAVLLMLLLGTQSTPFHVPPLRYAPRPTIKELEKAYQEGGLTISEVRAFTRVYFAKPMTKSRNVLVCMSVTQCSCGVAC